MLRRDNYFYIILTLISLLQFNCQRNNNELVLKEKCISVIGVSNYKNIIRIANDSIINWKKNNFSYLSESKGISEYTVDSLLISNKSGTRVITCLLAKTFLKPNPAGGIEFFYGERINDIWYFTRGASIFIPYEMKKSKNQLPYDYSELHQIALKEVYRGYLKSNGEINEELFIHHFDNAIMNFRKYKNKEEYNKLVIAMSKSVWAEKFTPYTQESFDFNYNKNTKTVDFSFRLQTFDSVYCQPTTYKVIYQHKDMEYPDGACGSYWCDEIDWNKQKYAHVQLKNVPENSDVTIKIQVLYFPVTKSPVMGPFIFNTGKVVKKINS